MKVLKCNYIFSQQNSCFRLDTESSVIRTAKSEKRANIKEGISTSDTHISPADKRKAEAEKRSAWRQARLKSLENVNNSIALVEITRGKFCSE